VINVAEQLSKIYARIPAINCKRKCQECCGPIMMSKAEYAQAFGNARAFEILEPYVCAFDPIAGSCPKLLRTGDCGVYENRPAICRLWGVVRKMACPFGCEPERWLSDKEARVILGMVDRIGSVK